MARQRGSDRGAGDGGRAALAWFVSPHGLGHAARAAALMAACSSARPDLRHHLFTTVPRWFFDDSLPALDLHHHRLDCDIGMVQLDPLTEDVEATAAMVGRWLAGGRELVRDASDRISAAGCRAVIADISPLGLAAAAAVGVPGILVENFTWDWIYRGCRHRGLDAVADELVAWFELATLRIQTEPVCRRLPDAVQVPTISRRVEMAPGDTRRRIGLREEDRMVLIGQGAGSPTRQRERGLDLDHGAVRFVVPDPTVTEPTVDGSVVRTPRSGTPRHPDLVAASDLVIAKLGYSTVAEAYHAGTPLAYLCRPRFPESSVLEAFVRAHLPSAPLQPGWADDPGTAAILERLVRSPRPPRPSRHGAAEAAGHILAFLHLHS